MSEVASNARDTPVSSGSSSRPAPGVCKCCSCKRSPVCTSKSLKVAPPMPDTAATSTRSGLVRAEHRGYERTVMVFLEGEDSIFVVQYMSPCYTCHRMSPPHVARKRANVPIVPFSGNSAANTLLFVAVNTKLRVDTLPSPSPIRWNTGSSWGFPVRVSPTRGLYQSTTPASEAWIAKVVGRAAMNIHSNRGRSIPKTRTSEFVAVYSEPAVI